MALNRIHILGVSFETLKQGWDKTLVKVFLDNNDLRLKSLQEGEGEMLQSAQEAMQTGWRGQGWPWEQKLWPSFQGSTAGPVG